MGSKKQNHGDFFEITSRFPWWVSLLLAIASYLLLHGYTTGELTSPVDIQYLNKYLTGDMLRSMALVGQYLLPVVFLLDANVSIYNLVTDRKSHKGAERPSRPGTRTSQSKKSHSPDKVSVNPVCPKCGSKMVLKTTKGENKDCRQFWGCGNSSKCHSVMAYSQRKNTN